MEFDKIIKLLEFEKDYASRNYVPIIRDKSAKYLYDFIKNNNIKKVLEIGTAIGYSGSIMISAGVEVLKTVDINKEYLKIAKNTFEKCGYIDCVDMVNLDAKLLIKELVQNKEQYDMVFLDGAKGQYINYLDDLVQIIGDGGVIFADNVLLHGMVESQEKIPHKKRTMVVNLRKYLDVVKKSPFETKLVRLEDGIAITKYKGV